MSNSNWFMDEIKKFSLGSTEPSKKTSPEFEKQFMAFQIKWLEDCVNELKQSQQWQPIETAPKEKGTKILLYFPAIHSKSMIELMVSQTIGNEEVTWKSDDGTIFTPTHWMPLPKPPTK